MHEDDIYARHSTSRGARRLDWLMVFPSPHAVTLLNNPQATSAAAAIATVAYFLSFGIALFNRPAGSPPPLKCL